MPFTPPKSSQPPDALPPTLPVRQRGGGPLGAEATARSPLRRGGVSISPATPASLATRRARSRRLPRPGVAATAKRTPHGAWWPTLRCRAGRGRAGVPGCCGHRRGGECLGGSRAWREGKAPERAGAFFCDREGQSLRLLEAGRPRFCRSQYREFGVYFSSGSGAAMFRPHEV